MSKNECEAIAILGIPLCLPSCALPENGIWLGLATDLQRIYNGPTTDLHWRKLKVPAESH